jgi:hypothetical protein
MSAVTVDLPNSLRQKLEEIAQAEGVSLNELIVEMVEKISANKALEQIKQNTSKRDTRKSFEKFLAAVPDVEPDNPDDRIKE